jgi:hypothetical protein
LSRRRSAAKRRTGATRELPGTAANIGLAENKLTN